MVGNFFIDNIKYPIFDDIDTIGWYEHIFHSKSNNSFWNDIICVNLGLDKTLAPLVDEIGSDVGSICISDRSKILEFLEAISNADYREIFLDVRFPKYAEGVTSTNYRIITDTIVDNKLFTLISNMRNIVVANHLSNTDPKPLLKEKYGMADYGATIFSSFGRYELRQNGKASAALKMYQDIDNKDISPKGFFTENGKLCYNTVFPLIPQDLTYPTHLFFDTITETKHSLNVYNYPLLDPYPLTNTTTAHLDSDNNRIALNDYITTRSVLPLFPQDFTDSIPLFYNKTTKTKVDTFEIYNYPLLGSYLLAYNTAEELQNMVKDKIVIIGDFEEDIHQTYVGEVPGSMLSFLAYKELHKGNHLVGWRELLIFFIFSAFIYIRLSNANRWYEYILNLTFDNISNNKLVIFLKDNDVIPFIMSFLGWGVLIFLMKIGVWTIGYSLSVPLPTIVFTILDFYIRFKTKYLPNSVA